MSLAFTTRTNLMSHQRAAVAKVLPSRIGGLLMEMGTGKTRVAIELAKLRAHKVSRVVVFGLPTIYKDHEYSKSWE